MMMGQFQVSSDSNGRFFDNGALNASPPALVGPGIKGSLRTDPHSVIQRTAVVAQLSLDVSLVVLAQRDVTLTTSLSKVLLQLWLAVNHWLLANLTLMKLPPYAENFFLAINVAFLSMLFLQMLRHLKVCVIRSSFTHHAAILTLVAPLQQI